MKKGYSQSVISGREFHAIYENSTLMPLAFASKRIEVYSRQLLGADVLVEVEIGGSRVRAKADTAFAGNVGAICYLTFASQDLYFFDAEDGIP